MTLPPWNREPLRHLLQHYSVLRGGIYRLSSGEPTMIYIDGRKVTLTAAGAYHVGCAILHCLSPSTSALGGPIIGADPIVAAALALAYKYRPSPLHGFLVRPTPKGHGTLSRVEGPSLLEQTATIVDDVTTTGRSVVSAIEAARAAGARVDHVIVLLDRLESARENVLKAGCDFRPLFTIRDLGIEPEETRAAPAP